jgi:tripartite-type tricarboxylate transporter receptor subunit TctC
MRMIQNMTRRQVLLGSLAFSTAFFISDRSATARSYPTKPIRLLVGGAAGSVPDTLARVIADRLSPQLGQPVLVENRPGAGGALAISGLIGSEPDGHTLALATMSQAVFNRYLYSKLPYDPQRDLEPVAPLATGAMAVAAHPSFAATNFSEFVAIAKAHPDKVLVATTQVGSPPYVFSLLLARATGVKIALIPHRSGVDGMTAVLRGDVQIFVDAPTIIAPQVKAGAVKALAVTGRSREAELPGVPTVSEAGYPSAQAEAWIGLVAPAHTPSQIVSHINRVLVAILGDVDFRRRLEKLSFAPMIGSPEEFRTLIQEDHARWGALIRDAGISLD